MSSLELDVFNFINGNALSGIGNILTIINEISIYIFFVSILFALRKSKMAGINYTAMFVVSAFISLFLQMVFQRVRPTGLLRTTKETSYSFPSTHSTIAFAWAGFFSGEYKKFAWLFYSFAVLVAVSRVYVGVHYPSDVIAGAILGTIISKILSKLESNKILKSVVKSLKK